MNNEANPDAGNLLIPNIPNMAIVTSGETSDEDVEHGMNIETTAPTTTPAQDGDDSDEEPRFPGDDDLFDENADIDDEAYVYSQLRSGVEESVSVKQPNTQQLQDLKVLKPRNSDAILSCPCCFHIVCMDCQRHERYSNQFRAMFVMNIAVKWDHRLVYDDRQRMLIEYKQSNSEMEQKSEARKEEELYYTVCCANCTTTVAALDMEDEVYHFYGCLATA